MGPTLIDNKIKNMNNIVHTDKENSIIPSTPLQQLKPQSLDGLTRTKSKRGASLSPTKRLPFAAKDNNVSSFNVSKNLFSNIVKQPLVDRNKNKDTGRDNTKRLKKYGSILDINNDNNRHKLSLRSSHSINLPRTKSLILKDPIDSNKSDKVSKRGESESESGSDEEWSHFKNNSLKLKLQNVLDKKASNTNVKSDVHQDDDIEYRSKDVDEIPYIPDGYIPFSQEDLNKLSEYHPYNVLINGTIVKHDEEEENTAFILNNNLFNNSQDKELTIVSPTLLPLETCLNTSVDDDHHNDHNTKISYNKTLKQDSYITENEPLDLLPIDIEYNGDGLNDDDIVDLIDNDI